MTKTITVIGGGPGGYECAIRAAQLGAKVVLIEDRELGGTCLNRGCIPTKTLWRNAEIANSFRRKVEFGFDFDNLTIDGKRIQERKNEVVGKIRKGVEFLIDSYKNIEFIPGFASFKSENIISVKLKDGSTREVETDYTIVASGSVPFVPPIEGVDAEGVMTSDELLDMDYIPKSMVIVGGGVIGLEFACIYNELGTEITVISNEILGSADTEISKRMPSFLKKAGIKIISGSRASKVEKTDNGYRVVAEIIGKDKTKEAEGETLLIATGRSALVEGLNLDAVGVEYSRRGIKIDENMKTNLDSVYAIGDVTEGSMQLAHWASAQGIYVVEKLMGEEPSINLDVVPACTFTIPEVAQVGKTEQELKEKKIPYTKSKFMFIGNGKAVSLGEPEGFVKVLAKEDLSEIYGIHIVGPHANDLIHEGAVAVANKLPVSAIANMIHAHPTLSEAFMEAIHQLEGCSIHSAPSK
ncbi:MAG: dihydrolipoyl dehydrogenase [Tissierellia bacterium]|nr:dihydrolipoyl dehydrogenase [Tissierellia bacterium]